MKKIVAINASPRVGWNTWSMVNEAAKGAEAEGAEIQEFDLYKLENTEAVCRALRVSWGRMRENAYSRTALHLSFRQYARQTVLS